MSVRIVFVSFLCGLSVPLVQAADDERRFEEDVRPLLARQCVECHGPSKQEGGVRLDRRESVFAPREDGRLVVPGRPAESRLLAVLAYDELDVQMPPKGKLPAAQIAAVAEWVRTGAVWPERATVSGISVTDPAEIQRLRHEHWAFRPVRRVPPPRVEGTVRSPIDAFVTARLAESRLTSSGPDDRRTLVRRLSFDLLGVPPTYEEVQVFESDASPDAYERLVDRMLASPRFGERWGRHWLDVARYADTKGYVFTEDKRYPYAYTYRDYVIRSLNGDTPYDRFVREQLAADQLDTGGDPATLAALGFLTVGRRFMNREQEIIDDRIDVVTRGLQGLTVACARCHDHKYDPVPTADYYSLYGVFDSTHEPKELPLVADPAETAGYEAYQRELAKRQRAHDEYVDVEVARLRSELRTNVTDYLAALVKKSGRVPEEFYVALKPGDARPRVVTRWERFLERRGKPDDPVFGPWAALSRLPADAFEGGAKTWLESVDDEDGFNRVVVDALVASSPSSMYEVARVYGKAFATAEKAWRDLLRNDSAGASLEDGALEQLRQVLYADGGPVSMTREEVRREFDRAKRNRERALQRKIDEWKASSPAAPPRAMLLRDDERPTEPVVFVRGNIGRRGERVPRRFPRVLAGPEPPPFENGSGRLDLANAVADPGNPLTARVFVNRVWLHLFGEGLVESIDDFGLRSDPPSHPLLLDHLAGEFVAHGWSIKWLVREIACSDTYRQSSVDRPDARAVDPDNRLLWRQNRRRLDFEASRDAALLVAGRLDGTMFGRPVEITKPTATRRTVYGHVDRNNLPTLFRTFDFASPDTSTGRRPSTTVPQQALFGLNAPFVMDNATALASRVGVGEEAVVTLYRLALARDPTVEERRLAEEFLSSTADGRKAAVVRLAHVLLLTNEFAFVD